MAGGGGGGGGGGTRPIFGYRTKNNSYLLEYVLEYVPFFCPKQGLTNWPCLGQKKIPTLCRTTAAILEPCLGQRFFI